MTGPEPAWIPAGTGFDDEEMVFFRDQGRRPLDDALGEIDLIVTGPHASAAFPAELTEFVHPTLTERLQFDFTDVSTSPVARRWAALDPHVLYIENPHPRAVRDANRARPDELDAGLREAFARLRRAGERERPSLAGVDAVRPVTFGYLPVLIEPTDELGWKALTGALAGAGALGVDRYERLRDDLIGRVIEAKLRRLTELDPATTSVAEWRSATTLLVLSLHDTMNLTARSDGAICVERPPGDRLPRVVALSNRGDADGSVRVGRDGLPLADIDVPTVGAPTLRALAAAYRTAFAAREPDDVAFNRPYLGGYETQRVGPWLRARQPNAIGAGPDGVPVTLRLGAWQNEFAREFLLGPEATAELMEPGQHWVMAPADHVERLAEQLLAAHDLYRRWGEALA